MAAFSLEICFTQEQLDILKVTGNKVVVSKTTGENPNVAWQVLEPSLRSVITWDDVFGIYVSSVEIENRALIYEFSKTPIPAEIGKLYTFEADGMITLSDEGGAPDTYTLLNKFAHNPYMTVGLYEDANVDSVDRKGNIVFAQPLLLHSKAFMKASHTVFVWLQTNVSPNEVVTEYGSSLSSFYFQPPNYVTGVIYDSDSGKFIQAWVS